MNEFVKVLLSLSLSGTLLFLPVLLPKPLYRERFSIWLVVALILFLRKILIYRSFFITAKNTGEQISDIQILNLLADCMERLKVKGKIEVCISPRITSPVLVGFFHPCILLPDGGNSMCGMEVISDEGLRSEKADRAYPDKLYYIYADGTNQNDKPVSGFTDGAMGIFEDGTEWNNQEYGDWYETCAGKRISVENLKNYYPHVYNFKNKLSL